MIKNSEVSKVFNFVRGAIRGMNGREDFSNINFLVIGTDGIGGELTKWVSSAPDASVFFTNESIYTLRQYQDLLEMGLPIKYLQENDSVDIIIDNLRQEVIILGKRFSFTDLVEDSYTQGIHEFYL